MRTRQPAASPLYPKIRFALTDHPITVKAGISYSPTNGFDPTDTQNSDLLLCARSEGQT